MEIIVRKYGTLKCPLSSGSLSRRFSPRLIERGKLFTPLSLPEIYTSPASHTYITCDIAGRQKSVIYHDLIPRLTCAITCFVDYRENAGETVVKQVYTLLMWLPNNVGLRALFPQVPYISFETSWIGGARVMADFQVLYGSPIHIRYDRFLSQPREDRYTRIDIRVSVADFNPSRGGCNLLEFCPL